MTTDTLLIELGTEELPPKSLKTLATVFFEQITTQIKDADLPFDDAKWFASPRRLAVKISGLAPKQQDKEVEKRGPAVNVAFNEAGEASKAALGWARSNGISIDEAQRLKTDKGEWLLHKALQAGKTIDELLPAMVTQALSKLPIPKPMRWGSERIQFIRPVHTLTLMFGERIIAGEALGVSSNNLIQGHRFHHHGLVTLSHADNYEATLKEAFVVADYEERQQLILDQISVAEKDLSATALVDSDLLEEVTSLVEWPVTLVGSFDEEFLQVPAEPLIYSMKDHQKYFPVESLSLIHI